MFIKKYIVNLYLLLMKLIFKINLVILKIYIKHIMKLKIQCYKYMIIKHKKNKFKNKLKME